jgi:hypothetical protein
MGMAVCCECCVLSDSLRRAYPSSRGLLLCVCVCVCVCVRVCVCVIECDQGIKYLIYIEKIGRIQHKERKKAKRKKESKKKERKKK